MTTPAKLSLLYDYVPLTPNRQVQHELVRTIIKTAAEQLEDVVGQVDSPDMTLAHRHLQDAMFRVNRHLALHSS